MHIPPLGRCVIVGINGLFGRIWAKKLSLEGAEIGGLDLQASLIEPTACCTYAQSSIDDLTASAERLIVEADFIFLCIPEDAILPALPRLCELVRTETLLVDIASVKTRIQDALKKIDLRSGYLSVHPMFGPMEDFSNRAVCVVSVRENPRSAVLLGLMSTWGANISTLTAEQHDAATALVQATPHAALIAFGAALESSGIGIDVLWKIATPIQKIMLALTARVAAGEHDTYWSIQTSNPHADAARDRLASELQLLSAIAGSDKKTDFFKKLDLIRQYLGSRDDSLEELAAKFILIAR
jgi:prephenate dehydrogenase